MFYLRFLVKQILLEIALFKSNFNSIFFHPNQIFLDFKLDYNSKNIATHNFVYLKIIRIDQRNQFSFSFFFNKMSRARFTLIMSQFLMILKEQINTKYKFNKKYITRYAHCCFYIYFMLNDI